MTWTEGTLKICDGIIISSGYSGICTFIIGLIIVIWYLIFVCFMVVIMLQTIYMVTKQHTENVKEIDDKYKNLTDKID